MHIDDAADLRRDQARDQQTDRGAADHKAERPAGVLDDRLGKHRGKIERRAPGQNLRDAERGDDDAAIERARICNQMRDRLQFAGSMPLALNTRAAAGPENVLISACAASLFWVCSAEAGGISRGVLDFLRQRPDQHSAFDRHDLADLMHAKFGFAADDEVGDMAAFLELRLWPDLIGDAEALKQFVDIDAARAAARRIDIGDRFGGEQRALECVDRADVRLRRAFLHHDTDADGREIDVAAGRRSCRLRPGLDDGRA